MNFAPKDDPKIPCQVRLWEGRSVLVFVHPREWKQVAITGGTPMVVSCHTLEFPCMISSWGEFYRSGQPDSVKPSDFGVPVHGDYPATARIDWHEAIPDVLRIGLESSADSSIVWNSLGSQEMRKYLSFILRARKQSIVLERQLEVLRQIGSL